MDIMAVLVMDIINLTMAVTVDIDATGTGIMPPAATTDIDRTTAITIADILPIDTMTEMDMAIRLTAEVGTATRHNELQVSYLT